MKRTSFFLAVSLSLLVTSPAVGATTDQPLLAEAPTRPLPGADLGRARDVLLPGSVALTRREIDALILPPPGVPLHLPSIDRFTDNESTPLRFRPVSLFADGATLREIRHGREQIRPLPEVQHYLASNASTGIGLAVNPETGEVSGYLTKGGDRLQLGGNIVGPIHFTDVEETEEGSNSCGNEGHDLSLGAPPIEAMPLAASASAAAAGEAISYQAVVAIDTDTEWMNRFGGNAAAAMTWITELFLAMNVFYERDVETRLLIGDVVLRVGSDPYSVASDRFAQLNEFGAYWMENQGGVERQFAAMFSGRSICSGCFSGIAWVDQYCDSGRRYLNGSVPGSYSYNAIGSGRTPGNTAIYVGHELGHNLGSTHTHCYSPPVDTCYNGENGCYSEAVSCPAGGKGTIMSYCHVSGANGAGCGTSKSEFHPIVQARLESRLATELVAGCIAPYTEVVLEPEFSSTPVAGAGLGFGEWPVGELSDAEAIQVQNTGDAELTLSCALSGAGQGAYTIANCPAAVPASGTGQVSLTCTPPSAGPQPATLTLTTNDADEGQNTYALTCSGAEPPPADVIFAGGFENE